MSLEEEFVFNCKCSCLLQLVLHVNYAKTNYIGFMQLQMLVAKWEISSNEMSWSVKSD